jgi:hypothetical protein
MSRQEIISKTTDWIFAKPLGVTILILTNIVFGFCIKNLYEKQEVIEERLIQTLNTTVKENTEAINSFRTEIQFLRKEK